MLFGVEPRFHRSNASVSNRDSSYFS